MIIIDRNITALEGVFKAGQDVEGALSESACNDLIKRGWAHKSQAQTEADQDDAQNDKQTDDAQSNEGDNLDNLDNQEQTLENSESEGDQSEEQTDEAEEPSDEPEETEEVVIDSLKELDQALEQPTKTSGTSRKRGK